MPAFRPNNYFLLPTMACQASCRYCFAKKTGVFMDEATEDAAIAFIERTAPAEQDIHITFHGGEPLLAGAAYYRRVLKKISERFGLRAHLSVQSNLWAMTEELAELFERYAVSVGTSVDGPQDMCDAQRGAGYWAHTKAGEKILLRHRIQPGEICTFAAGSEGRAAEVYENSDAPYSIHGAVPSKEAPDEVSLSVSGMKRVLLESYEAYRADPAHSRITTVDAMAKGLFREKGCTCTFFDCLGVFAVIGPDGGLWSCERFAGDERYCFGNVKDPSLGEEKILASEGYRRLRAAEDKKETACSGCTHKAYCLGGCLFSALTAGTEKDPYCEAYKALFEKLGYDMALEMGAVLTARDEPTPVLAMAGDRPHAFDRRKDREAMRLALEKGRSAEPWAAERLRSRYPENRLNKLYLHLTFDCPLRCPHCYAEGGERKAEPLAPERFYELIREAADRRFRSLVLTGGEPLVYPGFERLTELLGGLNKKGMKLILRSSFGFEIPKEKLARLLTVFDEIVVSVDGDEQTHDARRGAGRYRMTVGNLEQAAALGGAEKLGLAATLSRADTHGAPGESVRKLADRLGIKKIRFRPVLPLGRAEGAEREPWQLCSEETDPSAHFYPKHTCGLGQNLYVEPDGTAYPCYAWCGEDKKLGELRKESLGELLDRGELFAYCTHDVDTNEKCRSCEVRYLCGGICKAWVKDRRNIDSGDFDCGDRKAYWLHRAELSEKSEHAR